MTHFGVEIPLVLLKKHEERWNYFASIWRFAQE